jgi:hypothetical protein
LAFALCFDLRSQNKVNARETLTQQFNLGLAER